MTKAKTVERPATLRERQKSSRRQAMLDAARMLFLERSYSKTTMEAIAEEAEVGVATIYNYFGTKEGVLAEIADQDFSRIFAECQHVIDNPPSDPVRATQLLFKPFELAAKMATDEMVATFYSGAHERDGPLREVAQQNDKKMRELVRKVLRHGKAGGKLSADLPVDQVADIILAVFNHDFFNSFVKSPKLASRSFNKFEKRVPLLFQNWH